MPGWRPWWAICLGPASNLWIQETPHAWLETLVGYVQDLLQTYGFKKRPMRQATIVIILIQYALGLLYCTNMGLVLLDVIDHFVAIFFLLVVCFFEGIMFIFDVKYQRLALALKKATFGNARTPEGRSMFPKWLYRLDFVVTVPAITGLLSIYTFIDDVQSPYGGYPTQYVILGWVFFGILVGMIPLTIWMSGPGTLPPIDELQKEVDALVAEKKGDAVTMVNAKNNTQAQSTQSNDDLEEGEVEA